jgi:Animal haem peroxidase
MKFPPRVFLTQFADAKTEVHPYQGYKEMRCHGDRESYYIVGGEGLKRVPAFTGLPSHTGGAPDDGDQPSANGDEEPKYQFGWISGKTKNEYPSRDELMQKVVALGVCMNDPLKCHNQLGGNSGDSTITSGYTYLGQFLAHEITFDKEPSLSPINYRSPEIDLDSLYGLGPPRDGHLYRDRLRLKVDQTQSNDNLHVSFENDLPRDDEGKAIIGDPRNDENLAIAQMHVAFSRFHNVVVDDVVNSFNESEEQLFDRAREEVVKYFQWIIVHDYLPKIVGQDVVDRVRKDGLKGFKFAANESNQLFIPLEFSAAAFRIGHSMVRARYDWNFYQPDVGLIDVFRQTRHSGKLIKLPSDWVMDWRRFFDFSDLGYPAAPSINMAKALDTSFALHIENIPDFPHKVSDKHLQAITIRNLIRAYDLGVPSGEEMAEHLEVEPRLSVEEFRATGQKHLLEDPIFANRTPLWYYILREAEIETQAQGGVSRLGQVGGLIVAGTILEIIRHSRYSIFRDTEWQPKFGRPGLVDGPRRFDMTDLLHTANIVAPIAANQNYLL